MKDIKEKPTAHMPRSNATGEIPKVALKKAWAEAKEKSRTMLRESTSTQGDGDFEIILDQRAETTVLIPEVWVFRIRIAAACRGWQKGIPIRIMNHFAPDFGQFAVGHGLLSAQSGHRDQTAAHAVRPWPVRGRKYWSTRANSHTDRSRTDPS